MVSGVIAGLGGTLMGVAGYYEYIKGIRDGWDLNAKPNLKIGER